MAESGQHLAQEVSGMNVGSDQDIAVSCAGRFKSLECGDLFVGCAVKGNGAFHDTVGDLASLVHLLQLIAVHRLRHLRIQFFLAGQNADLRAVIAQGKHGINGILDDGFFLFQSRIGHHTAVYRNDQFMIGVRALESGKMAHDAAFSETGFLVDNGFQINTGVDFALHQEICLSFIDQGHCLFGCFCKIRFVIDVLFRDFQADLCQNFLDLFFIAHQNRLHQACFHCLFYCTECVVIIGSCHCHTAFLGMTLQLRNDLIKCFVYHNSLLICLLR